MNDVRRFTNPVSGRPDSGAPVHGAPSLTDAVALLRDAPSVVIMCHVHPDADTIGSGLALGTALSRAGKDVQVSFPVPHDLPESLRSLPGVAMIVPPHEVSDSADLAVTVDCGSRDRIGDLGRHFDAAPRTLVIDHHSTNTCFGDVNVVDARADSTTVLIARLLDALGVELDADLAHCLYAGLVTDTGSFKWAGVEAHWLAARLLETGIDAAQISRTLLDTHPTAWLGMLSSVLATARLDRAAAGGAGLVHAVVRQSDVEGVRWEEVESVIDIVRTSSDAEVAAVIKERPDGEWAVSLRSKRNVDVAAAARQLGGGGHRFAAGYTAGGTSVEVLGELRRALDV